MEKTLEKPLEKTIDKKKIKLLVGMTLLTPTKENVESWDRFWTDLVRSAEFEVAYKKVYYTPTVVAQEEIARAAVDTGATHLLMIDSDIYDYKLTDLIKLLEADVDMIGGVMLTKRFPFHVCAMRRLDETKPIIEHAKNVTGFDMYEVPLSERKGVKPVDLLSFGFTLFKTDLFKKMDKWYFIPKPSEINEDVITWQYQKYTDSVFCDKVYAVGSQPYAHFDIWLNHNGVTRENVHAWIEIYKQTGKLSQPGIRMDREELLEYKMKVKTMMEDAETRFHSEALDKIKYFKAVEDEAENIKE